MSTATNYNFDIIKIRNRWNSLREYWGVYKRLSTSTGIGWCEDGWTIKMNPEWWDTRIKENPIAAKFQDTAPIFLDLMEKLFDPVVGYAPERYVHNPAIQQNATSDEEIEDEM